MFDICSYFRDTKEGFRFINGRGRIFTHLQIMDPLINTENVKDPALTVYKKFVNHANIKTIRDRFPNNRYCKGFIGF